jgi:hypothetical protein
MYEYEYRPLLLIFFLEFIVFFLLCLIFLYKRISFYYFDRVHNRDGATINEYLFAKVSKKNVLTPKEITKKRVLLLQLELLDKIFSHDDWNKIKSDLLRQYLLKYAKKSVKSLFWRRRMFAARCFALSPSKDFENDLIKLVGDKKIVVRIYAARSLINLQSKKGIELILERISRFTDYCYYIFQDFFQDSPSKVIDIIIKSGSHPNLFHACLKILAPLVVTKSIPFLKSSLSTESIEDRLLAIELFSNNPPEDAEDVLIDLLSDDNERVKIQVIKGLSWISTTKGVGKLQEIFRLSSRPQLILEAASALKVLGKLGEEKASEFTDYVLRFR